MRLSQPNAGYGAHEAHRLSIIRWSLSALDGFPAVTSASMPRP
jgi:hypothetical protein